MKSNKDLEVLFESSFFFLQIIAKALNQLIPSQANLILLSASHEGQCHLKEKWFGTQYSVEGTRIVCLSKFQQRKFRV